MKLSSIVGYLNHLNTLDVKSAVGVVDGELASNGYAIQNGLIQFPQLTDELLATQDQVKLYLQQYDQTLDKIRQAVRELIKQHEPEYFKNSTKLYQNMQNDTNEYILQRPRDIDPVKKLQLRNRLCLYTDWRYPGLVIRPAHSPWIEDLVALDPMYFVDTHKKLIDPATSKFTPEYQRRLRCYVIDEFSNRSIFETFPQEQFGFVYSFNYFNFRSLEVIKQYLLEVFDLLRTGGTFFFNFNDCDRQGGVALTEHHFSCYTPARLIYEYAEQVGYEIVHQETIDAASTWVELKKPGQLSSIRAGQTLAGVFRKPMPVLFDPALVEEILSKEVDIPIKQLYNSLNLDQWINLAIILGVDIANDTTKRMYNIKKVRRTMEAYLERHNFSEKQLRHLFKRITK
jgi:SAM-dependent methyltransferase